MKNIYLLTAITCISIGYYYFVNTYDSMPKEYKTLYSDEMEIIGKHHKIIRLLAKDQPTKDKIRLAENYIIDSKVWIVELDEIATEYKKISKGISMRKRSELAAKTLEVRKNIQLIEQTRIMLENALKGTINPEHARLLEFNSSEAYRKVFKNIPQKK